MSVLKWMLLSQGRERDMLSPCWADSGVGWIFLSYKDRVSTHVNFLREFHSAHLYEQFMMSATKEEAKVYLAEHGIPQLFECLLSSLMMERPKNPVEFIERKIAEVKCAGINNINWETFIYHLHPYRDDVRRQYIREDSMFAQDTQTESASSTCYRPEVFEMTDANNEWGENFFLF